MPKLSKRTDDAIRPDPNGREVFVRDTGDGALKGFGVRLMPSGIGSYLVQYRTKEGRTGDKLKEVTIGGDPSAERHRVRREALTIAELADLYLAEGPAAKPNKEASSWATDRSNIDRHVKPLLGRKLVASLTRNDVVRFQRDVATGKSRGMSGPKREAGRWSLEAPVSRRARSPCSGRCSNGPLIPIAS